VVLTNFIIGGAEKCGTTSVFDWLSDHPGVTASARKETNFFVAGYTGDPTADTSLYSRYFERARPGAAIRMEASPVYLNEAAAVAPRIRHLLPDAKLLFILRDPVDRLHSAYHFCIGKLLLPMGLSFERYVDLCVAYDRGECDPASIGLDAWFLGSLRAGAYDRSIADFRRELGADCVKVMFFEALRRDARSFMSELSDFLAIDGAFWRGYCFRKSNVTFSSRNAWLHRAAMRANATLEPVLRRHLRLKRGAVRAYKWVNQLHEGYAPMPIHTWNRLRSFYAPSIAALRRELGEALPAEWSRDRPDSTESR
jgi:hypothetical protein